MINEKRAVILHTERSQIWSVSGMMIYLYQMLEEENSQKIIPSIEARFPTYNAKMN